MNQGTFVKKEQQCCTNICRNASRRGRPKGTKPLTSQKRKTKPDAPLGLRSLFKRDIMTI